MKKVVVHNVRAIPFFESVNECVNDRAFYELRERHTHRSFGLSGTPSLAADNSSRNRMGMPSSTGACDASSEKNLKTRLPEKNFGQKMQVVVHDVRAIFAEKCKLSFTMFAQFLVKMQRSVVHTLNPRHFPFPPGAPNALHHYFSPKKIAGRRY